MNIAIHSLSAISFCVLRVEVKIITLAVLAQTRLFFAQVVESLENARRYRRLSYVGEPLTGVILIRQEADDGSTFCRDSNIDYTKIEIFVHEENLGCAGIQDSFSRKDLKEQTELFTLKMIRFFIPTV